MSTSVSENNRRIAKNTIALYFRTFITMIVGLYTGRVMLQALGVEDYGINNVVGGIIGFHALITSTMSAAISRYLTYTLGKGDMQRLRTMFSTAVNAQIVMSALAVIGLEIVGLWFLEYQANIPEGRMEAAHWVFQCSLISLVIGLISSPYNALLIAHERMGVYAYTSIVDAVFRLAICFVIVAYDGDRLILLSILSVMVGVGMRIFYGWYCGKHFDEAHYNYQIFDKGLLKELSVFSSWNLFSNCSYVFATQGVNMLINVFFGVAFNAARGIAQTVNGTVQGFVGNFTIAFAPQMTKSYAAGDKEYAVFLGNRGTKFTWLMMYLFIVPVCCEADMLLKIWLGRPPEWSAIFLRFAMFESLAFSSGNNLFKLIQVDGHIKSYTIHAAMFAGLIFPIVLLCFYLGLPVWMSYVVFIIDFVLINIIRFADIKRLMHFSIRTHFKDVIFPCILVSIVSFIVPLLICYRMEQSYVRFFVNVIVAVIWTSLCIYAFGLSSSERRMCLSYIKKLKR